MRRKAFEAVGIIAVCMTVCIILMNSFWDQLPILPDTVDEVSQGWYYLENGEPIEVKLPAEIRIDSGASLVLYNDDIEAYAGGIMTTRGAVYQLSVRLEKRQLYACNLSGFRRNDQMASKLYCDIQLPYDVKGQTLALTYANTQDGCYDISAVYAGSGSAVFRFQCAENVPVFMIVLAMLILSITALGIAVYLWRVHMYDGRLLSIAAFLILCGIWSLTDSSLGQLLTGGSAAICYFSFYAFMTMPIPMLHFLKSTSGMEKYWPLDAAICVFYINALVQSCLNYRGTFDLVDLLWVTHVLLILGVFTGVICLWKEYRASRSEEVRIVLLAFGAVGSVGLPALALYWGFEISNYELVFEIGILLFIIRILCWVISSAVANIHYKTEMMVYQRLSEEDRLTGMRNRRAYESFLEHMENSQEEIRDALLFYLDLNNLKRTNDDYGHGAGDELIVAAAQCIESTFAGIGSCYRIGGPEFCVIILNPPEDEKELLKRLEDEIAQYNRIGRNKLSIARGMSHIRNADGSFKTISDWRYEADQRMYRDKGWERTDEI